MANWQKSASSLTVMVMCRGGGGYVEFERAGFLVAEIENDDFVAESHLRVHFVVNHVGRQLDFATFAAATSP